MSISVDLRKLPDTIAKLLRAKIERTDGAIVFHLELSGHQFAIPLQDGEIDDLERRLHELTEFHETALVSTGTYEALVSIESPFGPFGRGLREGIKVEDQENGLIYELGPPSDEYTVFIVSTVTDRDIPFVARNVLLALAFRPALGTGEATELPGALELVRRSLPRAYTARVHCHRSRTPTQLSDLCNSFLFHVAYNLDLAAVQASSFGDYWRRGRLARARRSKPDELPPPHRLYRADLTYHYQLAAATESPVLAYLSLYHVAEHFFELVFNEDLIARVRARLTGPGFSHKRNRDVGQLIKEIQTRLKVRAETVTFNEQEALRLTLTKFVAFDDLHDRVQRYDKALIPHYRDQPVAFCDGDPVDLASGDPSTIASALARRIYRTRNAIVHSKEGERARFVPFQHDAVLAKEVPLLRFVAEDIIIGASELI